MGDAGFDGAFLIVPLISIVAVLLEWVVSAPVMRPPITWRKLLWPASAVEPLADRLILGLLPLAVFIAGALAGIRAGWMWALGFGTATVLFEQFIAVLTRPIWIAVAQLTELLQDQANQKLDDEA